MPKPRAPVIDHSGESMMQSISHQQNPQLPSCGGCGTPHSCSSPHATRCSGCNGSFCGKDYKCLAHPWQCVQLPLDLLNHFDELLRALDAVDGFAGAVNAARVEDRLTSEQSRKKFVSWMVELRVHPIAIVQEVSVNAFRDGRYANSRLVLLDFMAPQGHSVDGQGGIDAPRLVPRPLPRHPGSTR